MWVTTESVLDSCSSQTQTCGELKRGGRFDQNVEQNWNGNKEKERNCFTPSLCTRSQQSTRLRDYLASSHFGSTPNRRGESLCLGASGDHNGSEISV